MSDSNITKRAIAQALKELVEENSITKISVGNICQQCGLNRKSFYYHFQDKYELINWIYYTEFVNVALQKEYKLTWDLTEDILYYLDENKSFYHKVFQVEGQNSFFEYFYNLIFSLLLEDLSPLLSDKKASSLIADLYAHGFIAIIKKWLSQKDSIPPAELSSLLKNGIIETSHNAIDIYGSTYLNKDK